MKKVWMTLLFLFLLSGPAAAEDMYVTDIVQVTVRSGMGREYKILKYLLSNEKVEVLDVEGEYAHIVCSNGTEGWMLKRYLSADTPKPIVIENLQAEVEKLRDRNERYTAEIVNLKQENATLRSSGRQQERKIKTLETDFEELKRASADFIKLRDDYEALNKELEAAVAKNEQLKGQNDALQKNNNFWWSIVGGVFALFWFVVGMYLQGLRGKQKRKLSF